VFANPLQSKSGNDQQITYDMAQQEIANKSGLTKSIENGAGGGKSKGLFAKTYFETFIYLNDCSRYDS
jgi:hypothetical protein